VGVLARDVLSQFISNATDNVEILPSCLLGFGFFPREFENEVRAYL